MIEITFQPWQSFLARKKQTAITGWLQQIARSSEAAFRSGASRQWGGGRGSSPGEWPMRRTGGLLGSIKTEVTGDSVTIGSNQPYSIFLRHGTSRMGGRRKMSDDALKQGMGVARLGKWVEWAHGSP